MKNINRSPEQRRIDAAGRARLLAAFDRSGLSAAAFARQHQLNYTTFCGWRQRRDKIITGSVLSIGNFIGLPIERKPRVEKNMARKASILFYVKFCFAPVHELSPEIPASRLHGVVAALRAEINRETGMGNMPFSETTTQIPTEEFVICKHEWQG